MALLPKKYLRIHDVAEYLNNLNAGYEYDLFESFDRNRLNDDIYDLIVHGELKAVFKSWTGDFECAEAYFIVHDRQLDQILRFNNLAETIGQHLIYRYTNGVEPEVKTFCNIIGNGVIGFDDIYIPKEQLDALFNSSKVHDIEQQRIDSLYYEHTIFPAEHPKDNTPQTDLGEYQKELITYNVFTPDQIICLILNYPPSSSSSDRKFISYMFMIAASISSGELVPFNEEQQIEAQQVKVWLARHNYVYKDFNDHISNDPIAHIKQLKEIIAQLVADNNDLKEQVNNASIELEPTTETTTEPAADKILAPNSQAGVARMLYAILTEHGYDLSPTKGKGVANDMIVNAANNHGTSVTRNFVADWLIRAREANINNIR